MEIARRSRYYISRVLYAVTVLVVLLLVWEQFGWFTRGGWSWNTRARLVSILVMTVSIVQFAAVFLFVPMFLCGTVVGEREDQTLDLLLTTHLSDREIVLGKLSSRVVAMACLIFCGLPVMSLILLYGGGIAPEQLWRILAATFLAILYAGAHAVYFSVISTSTLEALVRTYWWLAVWLVGVPLLAAAALDDAPRFVWMAALAVALFVNPIGVFVVAADELSYDFLARYLGPWFFPAAIVLPLAWSLFLLWRAVVRLRQTPVPFLQRLRDWSVLRRLGHWLDRVRTAAANLIGSPRAWLREVFHGTAEDGKLATGHVEARRNPLWLRAQRAPVFDRTGHIRLIQWAACGFAALLVAVVAVFHPGDIDDEETSQAFVSITWAAVAGLVALFAGMSLVGDRRRGFLDLMLVTPLTGREIVDGTFLAVWQHLRPLFWLPWILAAFFCLTGASIPPGALAACVTATLFCCLLAWHGIACSLTARTFPAALVATFLLPLVVLFGAPLLIAMFEDEHGPPLWLLATLFLVATWIWSRRSLGIASVACFCTAVHLALAALASAWTYDGRHDEFPVAAMHPGLLVAWLLDDRIERWFRNREWFAVVACYWAALAVSILWLRYWLIRHFDWLAERTSGGARSLDLQNVAAGKKQIWTPHLVD
ncbi:MAG: ABC transporter permease subunit [Gemmataceae bacterium]|nr:ABC transporter permease subunit [Gemmataceae bacterium]